MSASFSLPRQFGGEDTTPEAPCRSCPGDAGHRVDTQFVPVAWGRTGGMLTHLGPHEFRWIELWGRGWERVDPNPWVALQKEAHLDAIMNGVLVPHQDDRTVNDAEQVNQKQDDLLPVDRCCVRVHMQSDPTSARRHTQGSDQVQSLIVLNARADRRGLPARRPGPLERRDERKACFIKENQSRPKLLPLFLSAARCNASSAQWLRHRGAGAGVGASDSSTPDGAASATRRWACSAPETGPRSRA